jgi:hypothetical protein
MGIVLGVALALIPALSSRTAVSGAEALDSGAERGPSRRGAPGEAVPADTAVAAGPENPAELADFAWLSGSWRGEGPDGAMAEIHFMPPEAGVLPSLFRLFRPEGVLILEAISLRAEEDGLFMYVRHFDPALVPLEEEHAIRLRLTGREGDAFIFENTREGENPRSTVMTRTSVGFTSWSELARPDGTSDTIRVEYHRRK